MKVALCIIDGCNTKAFEQVIRQKIARGTRPAFYQHLPDAYYIHSVGTFPTVTSTEHATLLTGCYPDRHGIAGMTWFDKDLTDYVRYHPGSDWRSLLLNSKDFLTDFVLGLNISHLEPDVDTIFEVLRHKFTASFKEFIARGAHTFAEETVTTAIEDLWDKLLKRDKNFKGLLLNRYATMWNKRTPDLMVYWKAWTDVASHDHGPDSTELQKEIAEGLTRAADMVDFYLHLKQSVVLIIVADHAQTHIHHTADLRTFLRNHAHNFTLGRLNRLREVHLSDALVVTNGSAVYVYTLSNTQSKRRSVTKSVVRILRQHKAVDLIFFRLGEQIMVADAKDDKPPCMLSRYPFSEQIYPDDDDIFPGEDIYPNAIERVQKLFGNKNAGDIVISLKEGWTTLKHEGDHGSLTAKDSRVPLLIHKFVPGRKLTRGRCDTLRTLDGLQMNLNIAPTIAKLFKEPYDAADGKPIKQVIKRYA